MQGPEPCPEAPRAAWGVPGGASVRRAPRPHSRGAAGVLPTSPPPARLRGSQGYRSLGCQSRVRTTLGTPGLLILPARCLEEEEEEEGGGGRAGGRGASGPRPVSSHPHASKGEYPPFAVRAPQESPSPSPSTASPTPPLLAPPPFPSLSTASCTWPPAPALALGLALGLALSLALAVGAPGVPFLGRGPGGGVVREGASGLLPSSPSSCCCCCCCCSCCCCCCCCFAAACSWTCLS